MHAFALTKYRDVEDSYVLEPVSYIDNKGMTYADLTLIFWTGVAKTALFASAYYFVSAVGVPVACKFMG